MQEMSKVKVAIIGLGSWGECHLEAFRSLPQVEVVAICDVREELVRQLGEAYSIPDVYTNADELLNRDDVDLVSVVTYENSHYDSTVKALQSGKHVLVEKPVATNVRESIAMWQTAKEHGRLLVPGHVLRFDPQYAEARHMLQSGRLGKPVSIYLRRARPRALFETYQRTHTVFELTVNDLDIAIWYAGSEVKSVKAYGRSVMGADVPDLVWACLEFANGALAVIENHWLTPNEANIMMADSVEVVAEQGIIGFEVQHAGLQTWSGQGRDTSALHIHLNRNGRVSGALKEELGYLCDCILSGEDPVQTSIGDAILGIKVAEAIIESIRTGREIKL